ncbi:acylamino-acid-releasing enzyme-like isoform X2 [Haliotis rufescens]|uniref:acylamino-acid-releasing enzyme-like isoform X2 n=1 Tax=Haliotis rufescens TaxID=6454 RepID=UPI00201F1815|nr:acylamino-acid-releasing enzyme-like isoform X2 [Haliotis rufescens]
MSTETVQGSKMVSRKAKDIVSVFRELAKQAQPTSATFSNQSAGDTLIANTKWSQRDLLRGEKTSFSKTYILSPDGPSGLRVVMATPPQEFSNVLWNRESPSGRLRAVVCKVKNKKGEEKQYFEIWNSSRKVKTFDIQCCEKHGKVYEADGQFGCLEWSPSERYLVYIAEKKVPKTGSFFEEDKQPADEGAKKEEIIRGNEHVFRGDWGEQLVDKHHPVPCVIDVRSGEVTVLDNIPGDISAGQASWASDDAGVVFVGWNHDPWRLGLIYCVQRRSGIYFVDLKNTKCLVLSEENRSVRSPRFNQDWSRLVYLDNPARGGHSQCSRLMMYDWNTKKTSVVQDIVDSAAGEEFQGIFSGNLPRRPWLPGGREIVLTTFWRSRQVPVIIDINSKTVRKLDTAPHTGSSVVLDVWNNHVILQSSAPDQIPYLMLGKLDSAETKWLTLVAEETKIDGLDWKIIQHQPSQERVHVQYSDLDYESVLCMPTSATLPRDYKPPLIVFPHGGPHTTFDCQFQMYTAGFCQCGYAVLMVNYRGSVGFGQNSIDSLLGNVGDQDVKDVWAAATSVIEMGAVDPERLLVFGGSHGGFLTTHLIGQYPTKFKSAACRNPVTDLTNKAACGDLADKVFEEIGQQFEFTSLSSAEILGELWTRSPLSYVSQVTTPILLMIGNDDLRVPTTQARQYYRCLKARNRTVRFLAYEDNSHPIITVPAESDAFVNIMLWFAEHMET